MCVQYEKKSEILCENLDRQTAGHSGWIKNVYLKIAINQWQDPSAVGSVHQYQEIMRKKLSPLVTTMSIFFQKDLMDSSQKLIRSSKIPREQPYQI